MNTLLLSIVYLILGASAAPADDGDNNMLSSSRSVDDPSEDGLGIVSLQPINQEDRLLSSKCKDDEKFLRLDLTTDDYGFESTWKLMEVTSSGPKEIAAGPPDNKNYGKRQRYIGAYCLSPGKYRFIILDKFKDGLCCSFGEGSYAGYLDNEEIFTSPNGDEDWERRGHAFTVEDANTGNDQPFDSKIQPGNGMNARDKEWLDSHNSRRKQWHDKYNKRYVPVKWSRALTKEAEVWAVKLAEQCDLEHDKNTEYGENISLNYGWGSWGEQRPTENILSRFVEEEADLAYPGNGHLTQVLWRSTKYIGCADAVKPYDDEGGKCHAQVCRYSKPGNCNMSKYKKSGNKNWWLEPMLMEDSSCGKECPPDGCS